MIAVKLGGKEFVSHQTSQTPACTRRALTSRDAHHPTRARLFHWYGTVNSYRFVLAGANDMHRYVYLWSTSNISGYIRAIGDVVQEHTVSCLYLESIENTIGGLMSMVSTSRMIRSAAFVSVLVISVELAQPCSLRCWVWRLHRMFHRLSLIHI